MTMTALEQTFLLPDLGEGLTEAEVVRWHVAEGDVVELDQVVVEVETAKSIVEVPSPYAGVVARLHAAEGQAVDVGKPLITIGTGAAPVADVPDVEQAGSGNVLIGYGTSEGAHSARRRRQPKVSAVAGLAPVAAAQGPVRVISPIVRRLARQHGVELTQLHGSGAQGLITRADVEGAILPTPVTQASGERRTKLTGFRKTVATALTRSRAEIPEATVWVDVDATALWELRESTRSATDPGPGLMAYVARFVVAGLKLHPVLNARIDTEREEIVELEQINLGIAVQGERGLVVPAVSDADALTTQQLDERIHDLTGRARVGKATPEELASGTFTLNNYGSFNVDGSAAIINHPQVAILGLGRIIDRPWVVDGEIVARKITQMSFVFDHRVCDGGTAASFLRFVADAMENPASAIAKL